MTKFIISTILHLLSGGECPEADQYPQEGIERVNDYTVVRECAVPLIMCENIPMADDNPDSVEVRTGFAIRADDCLIPEIEVHEREDLAKNCWNHLKDVEQGRETIKPRPSGCPEHV